MAKFTVTYKCPMLVEYTVMVEAENKEKLELEIDEGEIIEEIVYIGKLTSMGQLIAGIGYDYPEDSSDFVIGEIPENHQLNFFTLVPRNKVKPHIKIKWKE